MSTSFYLIHQLYKVLAIQSFWLWTVSTDFQHPPTLLRFPPYLSHCMHTSISKSNMRGQIILPHISLWSHHRKPIFSSILSKYLKKGVLPYIASKIWMAGGTRWTYFLWYWSWSRLCHKEWGQMFSPLQYLDLPTNPNSTRTDSVCLPTHVSPDDMFKYALH